jgi:uncharacterized RDD family membrane protein YckC
MIRPAVVEGAATAAAERALDGILAGPLPERLGRSLGEHRVLERVVAEAVAAGDLESAVVAALESKETARVVQAVVASHAVERLVAGALDDTARADLTDRLLRSPEFERALKQVLTSPEVRHALARQSSSLAGEAAAAARVRAVRLDGSAERTPRRWLRRAPHAREGSGVAYAGVATRGIALAVDAALATLTFLILSALVGLVGSLVGELRPAWLVGLLAGVGWALVVAVYFVGFWATIGQTPGMRLMGVRVRDGAGTPPGVGRSLVRLIGLGLAIIPCFAGFLPALVDDRRRALPDFLAGTVVLYEELVVEE